MARGRKPQQKKQFKRANGTGSVHKMSGNRRKPYRAVIVTGSYFDESIGKAKQIRKTIGYYETESEAKQALSRYYDDPYDITKIRTFKDVYDEWSERYYATLTNTSSARSYTSAFNYTTMLHNRNIQEITITMMKDCINNASCGAATQGRIKSLFNLVFDYAVESQYINVNTARQFASKGIYDKIQKERKEKIPLSQEHILKCHEAADYGEMKMILIGLYTGLRPDEICSLKKDNIHLSENYMIGGMKTAAGTDRYIPIHPKIKKYIEYYYIHSSGEDLIEASDGQNDKKMTYDKYRSRFKKCMKYIGADGLYSPHCTRHTFITKAKECGLDEIALKMIVGHEIRDITEKVYTHREKDFLHEEMNKLKYIIPVSEQKGFKVIG